LQFLESLTMRTLSIVAFAALGLTACNPAPGEGQSGEGADKPAIAVASTQAATPVAAVQAQAPDAEFARDDPSPAVLGLTRQGGEWRIAIRAGGVPNGAATAGDCEIEAVGPQDADDVINARPVPFNSDLGGLTAADIGAEPPMIQVRVGPEGVFVADGGAASRYCPMGSDVDGFYKRVETPD